MPTVDERLKHVTLKIKRGREHITELDRQLRAFFDSGPYKVGARRDSQTRKIIYYVTSAQPIPDSISLVAGDAMQNLMSALDHLAYQIVCSDTGDKPPNPNWIYFPIADDVVKYEDKKHGKMAGASQEVFDAIDALQPYKGGNKPLWALYRLNNIEKHRLLLTVGSHAAGIHLGQLMAHQFRGSFPAEAAAAFESMNVYLNPADKGFPLKAGFELYVGAVDEQLNPTQQFRFEVVLSEPGIIDGKSLLETVTEFAVLVENIVATLTPRLR